MFFVWVSGTKSHLSIVSLLSKANIHNVTMQPKTLLLRIEKYYTKLQRGNVQKCLSDYKTETSFQQFFQEVEVIQKYCLYHNEGIPEQEQKLLPSQPGPGIKVRLQCVWFNQSFPVYLSILMGFLTSLVSFVMYFL